MAIFPSFTVTSLIVKVGSKSSLRIVPIAVSDVLPTIPVVAAIITLKVSVGSFTRSSFEGTFANAVVLPAGKVTVTGVIT